MPPAAAPRAASEPLAGEAATAPLVAQCRRAGYCALPGLLDLTEALPCRPEFASRAEEALWWRTARQLG